jgi:hypothetical protein
LIKSDEAKRKGMDVSLFKRLSEAHPNAVVNLEYQVPPEKYNSQRMHSTGWTKTLCSFPTHWYTTIGCGVELLESWM